MTSYFNLLYHNIGFNSWFTLLVLILVSLAILGVIFICIIIMLDTLYRPNIPQYPFNIILDCVIPLLVLFLPSIIILYLLVFDTWFTRITLLILIHIFVLVPLFHYWSKLRCWHHKKDEASYSLWSHPRIYKNIAFALVYPLLWGVFFSLSRFLRLGVTYNIYDYIISLPLDLLVIIFILPYLRMWTIIFLFYFSQIRRYLWNECSILLYSSHIYLLQYFVYFRFMELIYKSSFIIIYALIYHNNKNNSCWWQRTINHLYYNPAWITLFMLGMIIFEIIITNKIYYGIYILFIYTSIYRIFSCYFAYAHTDFIFDCCFSDYCFLTDKKIKPRYPQRFWFYFQDAEYYFGFEYQYTKKQSEMLVKELNKPKAQWRLRKKVSQDLHQDYVNLRIAKRLTSPFSLRMAANYLHTNRVRWVHTERIINTPMLHSCCALFARSIYEKIVLLNSNWSNLTHIQAAHVPTPVFPHMYKPFNQTFSYHKKHLIGIQEENTPSNFASLIKEGVIVEPYNEVNKEHTPVYLPQANPDIIFIFKNSKFIDKRTHALDQKTNNPGIGNNKMLSEITPQRYNSTLDRLEKELKINNYLNNEILNVFIQLKETANNFEIHQNIWANNLHFFPNKFIPPLKLPQNFSYAQLTEHAKHQIKIAESRMTKISELLYNKKIPQINHGKFPKEALDLFENSEMQNLLSQGFDNLDYTTIEKLQQMIIKYVPEHHQQEFIDTLHTLLNATITDV